MCSSCIDYVAVFISTSVHWSWLVLEQDAYFMSVCFARNCMHVRHACRSNLILHACNNYKVAQCHTMNRVEDNYNWHSVLIMNPLSHDLCTQLILTYIVQWHNSDGPPGLGCLVSRSQTAICVMRDQNGSLATQD